MLKSVPILCRFKNLSVVLCVTLWYSNFSICLKLTHIVTYCNILEYLKPFLASHQDRLQNLFWSLFLCICDTPHHPPGRTHYRNFHSTQEKIPHSRAKEAPLVMGTNYCNSLSTMGVAIGHSKWDWCGQPDHFCWICHTNP